MNKEELSYIAYKRGLEVVETTSDMGGYPRGLGYAIAGFETFEEAQALADEYGLIVVRLERRDGWQLWYNSGQRLWEAPILTPEDLDYMTMYEEKDTEWVTKDCKEIIEGLDDLESIAGLVQSRIEIIEELECLEDDEAIFTERDGGDITKWEKVNIRPTLWSYDTHNYMVAVSKKRKD